MSEDEIFVLLDSFLFDDKGLYNELINEGYKDTHLHNTNKGNKFVNDFYKKYKNQVYQLIKEYNGFYEGKERIEQKVNISDDALEHIKDSLLKDGLLRMYYDERINSCYDYVVNK